jgi:3-oxoacyl-[acyl-carrier protein] reductase
MLDRRFGRIVNITSIAALRPRPKSIAYSAAKAGVIALTKCCAAAFAPDVRVNALAPGLIDTEIIAGVDPEVRRRLIGETPLGRIGQPEDMAKVVAFLLSDESDFMTGQTVVASGGRVMLP